MPHIVGRGVNAEMRAVHPSSVRENCREPLALHEPQASAETCRGRRLGGNDGQALGRVGAQALKRARRLARRALITARPARVRIRSRKPWVLFRFSTLGWKVRFMVIRYSLTG